MRIGDVLDFVCKDLSAFIARKEGGSTKDYVSLSTILNPDGSVSVQQKNQVLMVVMDIREDSVAYTQVRRPSGAISLDSAPLHLDLYLLFAAYFPGDRVREALNQLSLVLGYFQIHSTLNQANTPGLPEHVERLSFELVKQEFHEKSHMWGLLGSKYMPSVLYKVKMLTIDDRQQQNTVEIREVQI